MPIDQIPQTVPSADLLSGGAVAAGKDPLAFARRYVLPYAMVGVLVILMLVSDILYPGFFDSANLKNMLSQNAPVGLVALGMTFVIIGGGFDLSVSAIFAAGGVFVASFANHMPIFPAVLLALGVGMLAGAVNGLVITRLRVNPFVATLGTASIFSGVTFLYSHSQPIISTRSGFDWLGNGTIAGIPVAVVLLAICFAITALLLSRTVYGRSVYEVGGNREAARLSGMRVDTIVGSTYLLTGLFAALAGIIIASRTGTGQADLGASITLDSIAIVIIGGTSLVGGEGAMWRTLVGLLILATINNLFDSLALDTAAQSLVKGVIIVGAVALDTLTRQRA